MSSPLVEPGSIHDDPIGLETAWTIASNHARQGVSESSWAMWFAELEPAGLVDNVLELVAPSAFVRSRLTARHLELLTAGARIALGPGAGVRISLPQEDDAAGAPGSGDEQDHPGAAARPAPASAGPARGGRRPRRRADPGPDQPTLADAQAAATPFPDRYTFDGFVMGQGNKFAHAAAMAVAEAPPSKVYNPLFIYGGVGLGKTHLLFAIANHMTFLAPRTRVRYVTSESFMTEFIKAVRERRGFQFQRQYRDVDVLLLADVQFLARAEESQTEFFNSFIRLTLPDMSI